MNSSFRQRWQQLNWDDLTLQIYAKNTRDVEQALASDTLTLDDFMALLSLPLALLLSN